MASYAYLFVTLVLCQIIAAYARPQFDNDNIIFPTDYDDDDNSGRDIPVVRPFSTPPTPVGPQNGSGTGTTTTAATPTFLACVAACQTTSQYSPVCGTNRQNYDNIYKLQCAQRCGLNIEVSHLGTCAPLGK